MACPMNSRYFGSTMAEQKEKGYESFIKTQQQELTTKLVEVELSCGYCLSQYAEMVQPKMLPCGKVCCAPCILDHQMIFSEIRCLHCRYANISSYNINDHHLFTR